MNGCPTMGRTPVRPPTLMARGPSSAQVKSRWRRIFRNTASTVSGWAAARRRNGSGAIVFDPR